MSSCQVVADNVDHPQWSFLVFVLSRFRYGLRRRRRHPRHPPPPLPGLPVVAVVDVVSKDPVS